MRIPEDRARCAGNPELSIDQRIDIGFEYLGREATPREHLPELLGVLSNVGFVGSDVRDRQQRYELAKNLLLMLGNVSLNRGPRLCRTVQTC